VPEDFSAKLTSGATGSPQQAAMSIRLDDANGFIIGKMAETVQSELERQIAAAAVGAYFQAAFGGLDTFTNGLRTAADGATQLNDGISKLHNGSGQLVTGSRQVADGVHQINLTAGPLLTSAAQTLPGIARTAGDLSTTAKQISSTAATGTEALAADATKVSDNLAAFAAKHPDITSDPLFQAAQQATAKVSQDTTTVAELAGRIDTLAGQVAGDVARMQQDVPGLQDKLTTASADLAKLDTGAKQVADGNLALDKGLADAATGAGQLAAGLHDAQSKVPTLDAKQRADMAGTLSNPVRVELSNVHPATVYGRGLAPFFFGIALWVFGIVAFLLLRPVSTRLLTGRAGPLTTAFAAWLPVFTVGLTGGLLLFLVVNFGLGLHPVDALGTIGVIALAVAAFTAIVHVLRLAFGAVGDALALVLLMIQLTSCGGLYPPETLPAPFKAIHPVLPMTHLVDALRVTISGGQASHLWRAVFVLAGYLAVALALLVWTAGRQRTWTLARLKPELSV
jgi:putative membrane protein